MKIVLSLILLAIHTLCCPELFAQDQSPPLPDQIQQAWDEVALVIPTGDAAKLQEGVAELNRLRIENDYRSFEEFSLKLLDAARETAKAGQNSYAGFLVRKGLELSPESAKVIFNSVMIAGKTGVASIPAQLILGLKTMTYDPGLLVSFVNALAYPLAWALTLAAYLVMLLTLCVNVRGIVGAATKYFPVKLRGLFAPVAALISVTAPVMFGPLWAIAGWAVFILIFFPKQRWVAFISGAIIVFWGAIIPIRETLTAWLDDDRVESMRRVISGSYSSVDEVQLRQLRELRPTDGVAHFAYGQLLSRTGEFRAASSAFETAERLLGDQPYTTAQQGAMAYQLDELSKAEELFQKAEAQGLNTADFWFNYSKLKIEVLDVNGSQAMYERAKAKDRARTEILQNREQVLEDSNKKVLADVELPFLTVLRSAMVPVRGVSDLFDSVAQGIMSGMKPYLMLLLGSSLMLVGLIPRRPVLKRTVTYYNLFKLPRVLVGALKIVPGGNWILAGRSTSAISILAIVLLVLMPLIRFPLEAANVLEYIPDFEGTYFIVASFGILALWVLPNLTRVNIED